MQYTTFGNTGLKVSVAGLGCAGNSRIGLGTGLSEAQSVALVREALDLGVNLLDTVFAPSQSEPRALPSDRLARPTLKAM